MRNFVKTLIQTEGLYFLKKPLAFENRLTITKEKNRSTGFLRHRCVTDQNKTRRVRRWGCKKTSNFSKRVVMASTHPHPGTKKWRCNQARNWEVRGAVGRWRNCHAIGQPKNEKRGCHPGQVKRSLLEGGGSSSFSCSTVATGAWLSLSSDEFRQRQSKRKYQRLQLLVSCYEQWPSHFTTTYIDFGKDWGAVAVQISLVKFLQKKKTFSALPTSEYFLSSVQARLRRCGSCTIVVRGPKIESRLGNRTNRDVVINSCAL